MSKGVGIVRSLEARGFDRSRAVPFEQGAEVGCSQCEALCINGVPCHESGCPNRTYECKGCGEQVQRAGDYCWSCRGGEAMEEE